MTVTNIKVFYLEDPSSILIIMLSRGLFLFSCYLKKLNLSLKTLLAIIYKAYSSQWLFKWCVFVPFHLFPCCGIKPKYVLIENVFGSKDRVERRKSIGKCFINEKTFI
jgi:hypothetical protein